MPHPLRIGLAQPLFALGYLHGGHQPRTGLRHTKRRSYSRSILGVLEPLTALVLGILFLGEELTPSMAAGIGLILPAVLIIILRRKA